MNYVMHCKAIDNFLPDKEHRVYSLSNDSYQDVTSLTLSIFHTETSHNQHATI